jgi:N-acetylglucosaminyl-diphospho-decaprenol L-rhamnosyltransferase
LTSNLIISSNIEWTVITVTFNSAKDLQRNWTREKPEHIRWLVVDNFSADNTIVVAQSLGAEVLCLEANVGFSKANNLALAHAKSKYVLFANPDLQIVWGDLYQLASEIKDNDYLLAPRLLNLDGTDQNNARSAPFLWHKVLNRLPFSTRGKRIYNRQDSYRNLEVVWVTGAAVAAKNSTLGKLGGWCEDFFLYYEDAELCLRAREFGFETKVSATVSWKHAWARETKKLRIKPWVHEIKSAIIFYSKYPKFLAFKRSMNRLENT